MLRCKEENLFFSQIYIRFGTCEVRRLETVRSKGSNTRLVSLDFKMKTFKALYNLKGKSQAFCPPWTVSSLPSSSDLVRGVHVHARASKKRGWQREKKKESLVFRTSLIPRLQSRAFRVSRVSLDGLRKKRDWLLLVYVHLGDKFLV